MRATHDGLPRNGPLSGMVLPLSAAVLFPLGVLVSPAVASALDRPLTPALLWAFTLTVVVMIVHKAESWWAREQDWCPVYLTAARAPWARSRRDVNFVVFVGVFLAMLVVVLGFAWGGPWPLAFLAVWSVQGIHELHHTAKTAASGRLYPGTITSVVFVGAMALVLVPAWVAAASAPPAVSAVYGALLPGVWLAFWVEHRRWLRGVDAAGGYDVLRDASG